jgi:methionine synthase II (cobalamin-independent)
MFGIDDAILVPAAVSAVSAGLNYFGNQERNKTSVDLANQANQFSAQQYATRYQTTVKDLEAAGLNPMLAYGQGAGSPPSAVGIAQQTNKWEGLPHHIQSGVGAANTAMQTQLTDAQVNESISRTTMNEQTAKLTDAQIAKTIAEIPNIDADTKNKLITHMLIKAQTGATSAQEQATRQGIMILKPEEAKSKTEWGKLSPYIKDVSQGVSSAVNAKSLIGK